MRLYWLSHLIDASLGLVGGAKPLNVEHLSAKSSVKALVIAVFPGGPWIVADGLDADFYQPAFFTTPKAQFFLWRSELGCTSLEGGLDQPGDKYCLGKAGCPVGKRPSPKTALRIVGCAFGITLTQGQRAASALGLAAGFYIQSHYRALQLKK